MADRSPPGLGRPYEEMKRTSRILELVQMVASAPSRYLRRDLAQHFEISERMVQKDLEVIRHGLKLPLRHSLTGYYFEKMPTLPALQYSFPEALALLLAVDAGQRVRGVEMPSLAAAVARLESLLPAELTPLLRQIVGRPLVTADREHRQAMLLMLNRALLNQRKVEIVYETRSRGGDISERVVHPYALVPYVRSWQLVAYCELRREPLIFKVDRIRSATQIGDRYTIPDDFELDFYLGSTWGLMRGKAGEPVDVVLHFEPEAGHWVAEESWHHSQQVEELADGSVIFRLHVAITPELVNWLLYYGSRVRVLQPAKLGQMVTEEHRRAVDGTSEAPNADSSGG